MSRFKKIISMTDLISSINESYPYSEYLDPTNPHLTRCIITQYHYLFKALQSKRRTKRCIENSASVFCTERATAIDRILLPEDYMLDNHPDI